MWRNGPGVCEGRAGVKPDFKYPYVPGDREREDLNKPDEVLRVVRGFPCLATDSYVCSADGAGAGPRNPCRRHRVSGGAVPVDLLTLTVISRLSSQSRQLHALVSETCVPAECAGRSNIAVRIADAGCARGGRTPAWPTSMWSAGSPRDLPACGTRSRQPSGSTNGTTPSAARRRAAPCFGRRGAKKDPNRLYVIGKPAPAHQASVTWQHETYVCPHHQRGFDAGIRVETVPGGSAGSASGPLQDASADIQKNLVIQRGQECGAEPRGVAVGSGDQHVGSLSASMATKAVIGSLMAES